MERFSSAVDMAVVAKCSLYCKSVAKKVTMNIRSKYQKFIEVSGAVCAICSGDQPQASSLVMGSGKKVMTKEKANKKSKKRKKMAVAKTPLCLDAINEGIKHEEKNEGLKQVKEVLVKFLHNNGVEKMTKKKGELFDHNKMECLSQEKDEKKQDGEVLEVLQKGYFINDKVLRFAKVKVNKL